MSKKKCFVEPKATKAKVMLASGESLRTVGRALGVSPKSVREFARDPVVEAEIKRIRADLAGQFEDLAKRALTDIPQKDIEKTSVYQRTLIAGIATDKSSQLRGTDPEAAHVQVQINILADPSKPVDIKTG